MYNTRIICMHCLIAKCNFFYNTRFYFTENRRCVLRCCCCKRHTRLFNEPNKNIRVYHLVLVFKQL